jgi:hypothetical protein
MDVPTRQAFISQIFGDGERVKVYAITNIFRNISGFTRTSIGWFYIFTWVALFTIST